MECQYCPGLAGFTVDWLATEDREYVCIQCLSRISQASEALRSECELLGII